jgi:hypothetical protein
MSALPFGILCFVLIASKCVGDDFVTLESPVLTSHTNCFNTKQLFILSTYCVYMFCPIPTIILLSFLKLHLSAGICNADVVSRAEFLCII